MKTNLLMLKMIHEVKDEVLGYLEGITNLGPFSFSGKIGMMMELPTLILSLGERRYSGKRK